MIAAIQTRSIGMLQPARNKTRENRAAYRLVYKESMRVSPWLFL
jgi:hypothetical protein